jgi:hypothetical protein
MLNELELKEKLQAFARTDFKPAENVDITVLLSDMLQFIGSTDSVLRDDLIYSAFANWILEYRLISPEMLSDLTMKVITNDHIFYRIGEVGTDSVFRRSFSMLLLPLILIYHRSQPFLSKEEIYRIKDALLRYEKEEKDRRGFVDVKGWAHSAAHYADALDDLARCSEMGTSDLREILHTLTSLLCRQDETYCWGEDDRFATVILAILGSQLLSHEELEEWIHNLAETSLAVTVHPQKMILRSNIKNFLQSLYFRVQWEFPDHAILPHIERALYRISPYTKK